MEHNFNEYRSFAEAEMEKLEQNAKDAAEKHEKQLGAERRKCEEYHGHVLKLSAQIMELDRALNAANNENESLSRELDQVSASLQHMQEVHAQAQDLIRSQEEDMKAQRAAEEKRLAAMKEEHSAALLAMVARCDTSKEHDIALVRSSMDTTSSNRVAECERLWQRRVEEKDEELEKKNKEIEEVQLKLKDARAMYEAEKSEVSVLKLRLQALQVSRGGGGNEGTSHTTRTPANNYGNNDHHMRGSYDNNAAAAPSTFDDKSMLQPLPSIAPMTGTSSIDSPMFSASVDFGARAVAAGGGAGAGARGARGGSGFGYNADDEEGDDSGTLSDRFRLAAPPQPPPEAGAGRGAGSSMHASSSSAASSLFAPVVDTDDMNDRNQRSGNGEGEANPESLMAVVTENEHLRRIVKEVGVSLFDMCSEKWCSVLRCLQYFVRTL